MPTEINQERIIEKGLRFRAKLQPPLSHPAVILIHGWTGDEFSMEVFSRSAPAGHAQLFPRGPVPATPTGFGWAPLLETTPIPAFKNFLPACQILNDALEELSQDEIAFTPPYRLVGFSQGAAMAAVYASLFPHQVERIAFLSGFLPHTDHPDTYFGLKTIRFFIAHGQSDAILPVKHGQHALATLISFNVDVSYCEHSAGHKVPAECMAKLREFLL